MYKSSCPFDFGFLDFRMPSFENPHQPRTQKKSLQQRLHLLYTTDYLYKSFDNLVDVMVGH